MRQLESIPLHFAPEESDGGGAQYPLFDPSSGRKQRSPDWQSGAELQLRVLGPGTSQTLFQAQLPLKHCASSEQAAPFARFFGGVSHFLLLAHRPSAQSPSLVSRRVELCLAARNPIPSHRSQLRHRLRRA